MENKISLLIFALIKYCGNLEGVEGNLKFSIEMTKIYLLLF